MDIPSLFMIPSAVSSGKVHSVFPNSTDADFQFNRDSDATRVNSEGLIERVGYYGSELITNGGFDTDSNWSKGTGWTITNGKLNCDGSQSGNTDCSQNITTQSSKIYKITYTISQYSAGGVFIRINSGNVTSTQTSDGTFTEYLTGAGGTDIKIRANSLFIGSIDNVSVVEVLGDRARLNYEIEGGLVNTKPSLLLEPQSTNLITQSEDFSGYLNGNIRIESNQIASPDGVSKSSKLSKSTFFENIQSQATISNSTNYSLSVFVKKGTLNRITLRLASGSNDVRKCLDLSDLSVSDAAGNQTGFVSSKVEQLVNDWYRFTITATSNGTTQFINIYAGKGNVVESGNIYIWGTQLEEKSFSTSYIPTNGSVQTRTNETCNGAGTSSIFNDSEGILMLEASSDDTNSVIWSISDGSNNNAVSLYYGSQGILCDIFSSVGVRTIIATFPITSRVNMNKFAVKYKSNDIAIWINGVKSAVNTQTIALSGLNTLGASYGSGSFPFYGKVKQIRVYNTKEMTDSEVDILLTKITS